MILDVVPVIPPDLRPMVQLEVVDSLHLTLTTYIEELSTKQQT